MAWHGMASSEWYVLVVCMRMGCVIGRHGWGLGWRWWFAAVFSGFGLLAVAAGLLGLRMGI